MDVIAGPGPVVLLLGTPSFMKPQLIGSNKYRGAGYNLGRALAKRADVCCRSIFGRQVRPSQVRSSLNSGYAATAAVRPFRARSGHLKRHVIGRIDRALVRPFNPDEGELQ